MGLTVQKGGALPKDANAVSIPVGSTYVQVDASGTAKQSPLTVSSTELELVPPTNAVTLVIFPVTANIRYGKQDPLTGGAGEMYEVQTAGNFMMLPVADGASTWVMRDASTDASLNFHFITV